MAANAICTALLQRRCITANDRIVNRFHTAIYDDMLAGYRSETCRYVYSIGQVCHPCVWCYYSSDRY